MVYVNWPGYPGHKKQKKHISEKKQEKNVKKMGTEISRGACNLPRIPQL